MMNITARYIGLSLMFVILTSLNSALAEKSPTLITLTSKRVSVKLTENGTIQQFVVLNKGRNDTISFRTDQFAGPAFESIPLKQEREGQPVYSNIVNNISYLLEYKLTYTAVKVIVTVKNNSNAIFSPEVLSLRLGINNYQDFYPQWRKVLFPTLLRSEKSHFWGYFMSPNGSLLSIASPNPIPSWTIGYERFDKFPHYVGSHRIHTSYLDLLRSDILRERQPQNRKHLQPGEAITDTIFLSPLNSLADLGKTISGLTRAPYISFDKYTLFTGEETTATIISPKALKKVLITQEGTKDTTEIKFKEISTQKYQLKWIAPVIESRYVVKVYDHANKQSEAILYVRANWSAYLSQARRSGLNYLPTTTSNTEAFYPLYSYFLARKFVPDSTEDRLAEKVFKDVFSVLFDPKLKEMSEGKHRLQNAGNMAAILADRFAVTRDTNDLVNSNGLLEFLMRNQGNDGGYYAHYPNNSNPTHYSCVNFVVKTMMEVLTQENKLAMTNDLWKRRYNAGLRSVNRALADLVIRKDNLGTEGQMSYDDGMIACCSAQLALGALRTPDPELRTQYLAVALELNEQHRCQAQQMIPDARMNGATLRFWESQFTINLMHNMFNSPCGWSLRRTYGNYYLYLLTGKKGYLFETMNTLGACSQLINLKNGMLYFSFVPDPYIKDFQFRPATEGSRIPTLQPIVVGEQYLPLISNWHTPPFYAWRPGVFGIDNFVHEVFKAIAEISLQNAFVLENEDGSFDSFNCKLEHVEGKLIVTPFEKLVKSIHINLIHSHDIDFVEANETIKYKDVNGLKWLGEIPEDIRIHAEIK